MNTHQILYIHGGQAYSKYEAFLEHLRTTPIRNLPNELRNVRWTDTLQEDLGDAFEVFTPQMPNKQNAKYEEWKIWFERHFEHLKDGVVLLGWSQGGYFLAKYLAENVLPFRCKKLVLLAAPFEADDFGGEDGGDFAFDPAGLPNLWKSCDACVLMHSTDDFVVPYEHALKYQAALPQAELVTFEEKNHFLIEQFPELLARIRESAGE